MVHTGTTLKMQSYNNNNNLFPPIEIEKRHVDCTQQSRCHCDF